MYIQKVDIQENGCDKNGLYIASVLYTGSLKRLSIYYGFSTKFILPVSP